jgi:hypothetical protein
MVKQSSLFGRESAKQISRAVASKNFSIKKGKKIPRVFFADPKFGSKNAVFASKSWLFGLKGGKATDPVKNKRASECKEHKSRSPYKKCLVASVGHPNKKGVEAYVKRIITFV